MSIFGFGYDEHSDDYKVLYAYYSNKGDENVILVYSFKYESWKRSDRGSNSGLTTETAKAIALPNYKHEATIFISESRRLLFAGFDLKREMEVWVMNVYAIEESWIKLVCISNLPVHHPLTRGLDYTAYMAMCNAKLSIAHVYENGDILMMVRHQLKLYRPNGKRGKHFNIPYVLGYMDGGFVSSNDFGFCSFSNHLKAYREVRLERNDLGNNNNGTSIEWSQQRKVGDDDGGSGCGSSALPVAASATCCCCLSVSESKAATASWTSKRSRISEEWTFGDDESTT
nr:F-box/kelch-repeat protein At3g23880-like [Ipomoea batatas]